MTQRHFPRVLYSALPLAIAIVAYYGLVKPPEPPERVHWISPEAATRADPAKVRVIDFSADWCMPCREMKRKAFRDPMLADLLNTRFVPVRYEMKGEVMPPSMKALMRRYRIGGFPAIIFVDAQGRLLKKYTDERSAWRLRTDLELLQYYRSRHPVEWYELGDSSLEGEPRPRVMLFTDSGCDLCDDLKKTLSTGKLAAPYVDRFAFVLAHAYFDSTRGRYVNNMEVYQTYNVRSLPAILVVDDQGHEVARFMGNASAEELTHFLDGAISKCTRAGAGQTQTVR